MNRSQTANRKQHHVGGQRLANGWPLWRRALNVRWTANCPFFADERHYPLEFLSCITRFINCVLAFLVGLFVSSFYQNNNKYAFQAMCDIWMLYDVWRHTYLRFPKDEATSNVSAQKSANNKLVNKSAS